LNRLYKDIYSTVYEQTNVEDMKKKKSHPEKCKEGGFPHFFAAPRRSDDEYWTTTRVVVGFACMPWDLSITHILDACRPLQMQGIP
jgi:hypothetical protein